jgi:hypothetical protein
MSIIVPSKGHATKEDSVVACGRGTAAILTKGFEKDRIVAGNIIPFLDPCKHQNKVFVDGR